MPVVQAILSKEDVDLTPTALWDPHVYRGKDAFATHFMPTQRELGGRESVVGYIQVIFMERSRCALSAGGGLVAAIVIGINACIFFSR
jgi:hypothetical protein